MKKKTTSFFSLDWTHPLLPRLAGGCCHRWCGRRWGEGWGRGCRWKCPLEMARSSDPNAPFLLPLSEKFEAVFPSPEEEGCLNWTVSLKDLYNLTSIMKDETLSMQKSLSIICLETSFCVPIFKKWTVLRCTQLLSKYCIQTFNAGFSISTFTKWINKTISFRWNLCLMIGILLVTNCIKLFIFFSVDPSELGRGWCLFPGVIGQEAGYSLDMLFPTTNTLRAIGAIHSLESNWQDFSLWEKTKKKLSMQKYFILVSNPGLFGKSANQLRSHIVTCRLNQWHALSQWWSIKLLECIRLLLSCLFCVQHSPGSQAEDSSACWPHESSGRVDPHRWKPRRVDWTSPSRFASSALQPDEKGTRAVLVSVKLS